MIKNFFIPGISSILISACQIVYEKNDVQTTASSNTTGKQPSQLTILLEAKSNSKTSGNIQFTELEGSVVMEVNVSGLTQGMHAIHIHQIGDCSSADGGSAGGHWNPTNQPHGKWVAKSGHHQGDIGNISANGINDTVFVFTTDRWCLGCQDDSKNIIGHSVIIHDSPDDFVSQPSGAAGKRIACAVIR